MSEVRKLHLAYPFRPFVIHMADGRAFKIAANESLAYHPRGDTLVAVQPKRGFSILDLNQVARLEPLLAHGKGSGKK